MIRTKMLSVRVTPETRRVADLLTICMTTNGHKKWSIADVLEEALRRMAKAEKVKA